MNEVTELWKDYRKSQQDRRAQRLPLRVQQLLLLRRNGFQIVQLSLYQFRVNDRLDIWPIHNRYHDIKENRRGGFRDVADFVVWFFKKKGGER